MDPDGSSIAVYLVLLFVLIMVNAFFAMSEISIISLNDSKVRKMAAEGDKRAKILAGLIDKPSRFLATIQVGITLSGFLASAMAADAFALRLARMAVAGGVYTDTPPVLLRILALVVITMLLAFFNLVLGELVPKRIAMQHYERVALLVARPLSLVYTLGRPFVFLLSSATNGVLRLVGIDPDQKHGHATEEEIRMLVDVGQETGEIEESDKDMIHNIFLFDDRAAEEMMSHRTEITAIELGTPLPEVVELARESGYSRIPVFEDDLDTIVGILYVKDLLELVAVDREGFDLRAFMRTPFYVPESANCKTLLKEFKEKKMQMAIVVDEYGGTSGLVTMEDLLESIVGKIQDEYDDEEEEISQLTENLYLVDGLTPLEDVVKYFTLEIPDEDDFDTIGGYIVNRLGHIPEEEEHPTVQVGDILFTIREMDERRVAKVEVERLAPVQQEAT